MTIENIIKESLEECQEWIDKNNDRELWVVEHFPSVFLSKMKAIRFAHNRHTTWNDIKFLRPSFLFFNIENGRILKIEFREVYENISQSHIIKAVNQYLETAVSSLKVTTVNYHLKKLNNVKESKKEDLLDLSRIESIIFIT